MESNTFIGTEHFGQEFAADVEAGWRGVVEQLGIDLERTARETQAIQRVREIRCARDLLRLVLFFALSNWSLSLVGCWAFLVGIGSLSDVAVLKRLRNARRWIGTLIGACLQRRCADLQALPGVRLRLLDATTVSHPGSPGADWRVHVCLDLGTMALDGLELTDGLGGETLLRFTPQSNEIRIVDGGYPSAKGMGPLLAQGGGLIVRINWRNVALRTAQQRRFEMIAWLKSIAGPAEQAVCLQTPQGWFEVRVLACPLPAEKAAQARRKLRLRTEKKGKTVSAASLFAAGFVLLLTNLTGPDWPTRRIFRLYRLRWQIELVFKRLKGLLDLDGLRAKDPELAQCFLLGKLLCALLLDRMSEDLRLGHPDWFLALDRPLNPSRLMQLELAILFQWVRGHWRLDRLSPRLGTLRRYLCDSPRARPQQLAWARALADHFAHQPFAL